MFHVISDSVTTLINSGIKENRVVVMEHMDQQFIKISKS